MIWENVLLAASSLRSNKMRALLTMLGIIIGIASIIAIVTIGDTLTSSVSGMLSSFGTNNITVSIQEKSAQSGDAFDQARGEQRASAGGKTPATDDLISDQMINDMLAAFPDEVEGVSLNYSAGSAQAKDGELYANISLSGANADYFSANSTNLLAGRFITDADVGGKTMTAVVSDKFTAKLFPNGEDPIGQQVKVYKASQIEIYTIIGVYEYEQTAFGGSTASDEDLTTSFYIPVTTAKQDLLEKNYTSITVVTTAGTDVNKVTDRLQAYFNGLYADNNDWKASVYNMASMLDTVTSTLSTISMAIAFIAGISLVVGGIGVMNIMLVSVTERTREIGTRKALGALNLHIRFQFVTEAIIISLVGGIIGLMFGIALGAVVAAVFGVGLSLSPLTCAASILFSMVIGVFFGYYPANKAAKLDPIDALRYE